MAFHPCLCTHASLARSPAPDPPSAPVFVRFRPPQPPAASWLPVCQSALSLSRGLHGSLKPKQAPALMVKPDAQTSSRLGPIPGQEEPQEKHSPEARPEAASDRRGLGPRGTEPDEGNPIPDTWRSFADRTRIVTSGGEGARGVGGGLAREHGWGGGGGQCERGPGQLWASPGEGQAPRLGAPGQGSHPLWASTSSLQRQRGLQEIAHSRT